MVPAKVGGAIVVAGLLLVLGLAAPIWGLYSGASASSHGSGPYACPLGKRAGSEPVLATFVEAGLPNGTLWSLWVHNDVYGNFYGNSTNSSIALELPPAGYNFTIFNLTEPLALWVPDPSYGCLSVGVVPTFTQVSFHGLILHVVTFNETGLPAFNAGWGFDLLGGPSIRWAVGGPSGPLSVAVPSGEYNFTIGNGSDGTNTYVPNPASGVVVVGEHNVTVNITFSSVTSYFVTFEETGLASGWTWCAGYSTHALGYTTCTSAPGISFYVPNGTYSFSIGNSSEAGLLAVPSPTHGTFTVHGSSVTVNVSFAPVAVYAATFVGAGLPSGVFWNVVVSSPALGNASVSGGLDGNNVTVDLLPNGTYSFTIEPVPAGYTATPDSGSFAIDGANATVAVSFS